VSADTTFSIAESPLLSAGTGLKVIVKVKGADGPGKISIESKMTSDTLSRNVQNVGGTHTFQFKAGDVPVGWGFKACAYTDTFGKLRPTIVKCTKGVNGP
jgi:hypothetical protein